MKLTYVLAPAVMLSVFAGCSGQEAGGDGFAGVSPSNSAASSPGPTSTPSITDGEYVEVEFRARDGDVRAGRLYGEGTVGVILSHMGRPGDSQDDWAGFAAELADLGYLVLTYQRRSDMSNIWQDVLGGAEYLREFGADQVIAGGASIGAMASLYAAEQSGSGLAGVIWLAGVRRNRGYDFQEADVSQVGCPLLFIAGDGDTYGAAEDTQQLYEWATAPAQLLIVPSRRHGTDLLAEDDPNAGDVAQAMVDWVEQLAAEPATTCS